MQLLHEPNLRPIHMVLDLVDELRRKYLSPAFNRRKKRKESSISNNFLDFNKPFDSIHRGKMFRDIQSLWDTGITTYFHQSYI